MTPTTKRHLLGMLALACGTLGCATTSAPSVSYARNVLALASKQRLPPGTIDDRLSERIRRVQHFRAAASQLAAGELAAAWDELQAPKPLLAHAGASSVLTRQRPISPIERSVAHLGPECKLERDLGATREYLDYLKAGVPDAPATFQVEVDALIKDLWRSEAVRVSCPKVEAELLLVPEGSRWRIASLFGRASLKDFFGRPLFAER